MNVQKDEYFHLNWRQLSQAQHSLPLCHSRWQKSIAWVHRCRWLLSTAEVHHCSWQMSTEPLEWIPVLLFSEWNNEMSEYVDEVKGQFLPFSLISILLCLCSWTGWAISQCFLKASEVSWTMIAIKAQPSTSSGLPASRQYFLAVTVNIILNDSPPES